MKTRKGFTEYTADGWNYQLVSYDLIRIRRVGQNFDQSFLYGFLSYCAIESREFVLENSLVMNERFSSAIGQLYKVS